MRCSRARRAATRGSPRTRCPHQKIGSATLSRHAPTRRGRTEAAHIADGARRHGARCRKEDASGILCFSHLPVSRKARIPVKDAISQLVAAAVRDAIDAGELPLAEAPDPALERPRDVAHGDWATTVALRSAKAAGMNPRAVAEIVTARMAGHPDIAALEIAGPGFINIRLSPRALQRVLTEARLQGPDFGRGDAGAGKRVQVEFVSANPVGPMHVGHGRWAALGDSMARVLAHAGWTRRARVLRQRRRRADGHLRQVRLGEVPRAVRRDGRPSSPTGTRAPTSPRSRVRSSTRRAYCWCDAAPEDRETHFQEKAYVAVLEHLKHVLARHGRRLRRVVLGAHAARVERRRADRGRARDRRAARGRLHLRARGRDVVPLDRLRRRQGPRADQGRRRLHVLRGRHRVPQEQVRPRLRPRHQHLGRRPPRLRGAHEGGVRRARAPGPARRGHRPAREPVPQRRGRADEQAHRRDGHLRGAARRGRRRRRALLVPAPLHRPAGRLRHRARPAAVRRQPGLLRAVRARAHLLDPAQGRRRRDRGAACDDRGACRGVRARRRRPVASRPTTPSSR